MDKLIIKGGADLSGEIAIKGSKNSALPIMVSALLSEYTLKLKNIPKLVDIENMSKLLRNYGSTIKSNSGDIEINCKKIINKDADYDIVRKMRASILILGPLLSRFGKAKISLPGGCAIGTRPIDIHLDGLKKLGAKFKVENGYVVGQVNNQLIGSHIKLPFPSVGATENIMMAAVKAKGRTIIENAAQEPEIVDLANSLKKMGAKIKIKNGYIIASAKKGLDGCRIKFPQISVGATENIILASCFARGKSELRNCASEPEILDLVNFLKKMGCRINWIGKRSLDIFGNKELNSVKHQVIFDRIETGTYIIAAALTNGHLKIRNIAFMYLAWGALL